MSSFRLGPLGCCLLTVCALPAALQADESSSKSRRLPENAGPMAIYRTADVDKDGKVSWEELKAVRPAFPEGRFKQLDKNSNGFIERAELPRPQERNGNKANKATIERNDRARYVAKLIATHDRDQSGDVTLAEIQADKPGFPESTFAILDRDKSGALGTADLPTTAPKAQKTAPQKKVAPRATLQEADRNKDGKLSFEEARVAFPNITEARFKQRDRNGDGFLSPADRQGQK